MARRAKIWWNVQKGTWCSDIAGKRRTLAKGKKNRPQAEQQFRLLIKVQELLSTVGGEVTVAKLSEDFLADTQQNLEPATYASYQYACQKFVDLFGDQPAHSIKPADISRFQSALKNGSPATAEAKPGPSKKRRTLNETSQAIVLRTIQRCFNWGVEHRLIPPHQLGRIRKPRPRTRDRFVSYEEFRMLLRATNPRDGRRAGAPFRRFLLVMDWTFCRPGEIARLKWEHIHWEQDVAILPHHKTKRTGKPKIIPLIPKTKRLLKWLKRRSQSEFCFVNGHGRPWTISSLNDRMEHVRERSGLKDIVPYTIRHRAATNSIIRTGDLKMTSLMLGHRSTATTERYTHLAQEHLVSFAKRASG